MTEKLTLIHYGAKEFNPEMFSPIVNNWVKPKGGLWTSLIDSKFGWKDWCNMEEFRECNIENSFILKFHNWAKVCKIDTFNDLENLPHYLVNDFGSYKKMYLDFEQLSKMYDAIWLTANGERETRYSNPDLYGWDCESVLILNKNSVYQVK